MIDIRLIGTAHVDAVWPFVAQGMQRGLICGSADDWTLIDLWTACRMGRAFLFTVMDGSELLAASIWQAEFDDKPRLRCLCLFGQNKGRWLEEHQKQITSFACENGCFSLIARGRKGWARVFPDAVKNGDDMELML